MRNRLLEIRPNLEIDHSESSPMENFQNTTLRPILKLQNALLVAICKNNLAFQKSNFSNWDDQKKKTFITDLLNKDQKLKLQIVMAIVSLMIDEELQIYFEHISEVNKRIISMAKARLIDNIV